MRGNHLGADVAPLLDGQMSPEASAVAWAHVADCEGCSSAVSRQIWVKAQLQQLSPAVATPSQLKQSLRQQVVAVPAYPVTPAAVDQVRAGGPWGAATTGLCLVGAIAAAALTLGQAPSNAPARDPRVPTVIVGPSEAQTP